MEEKVSQWLEAHGALCRTLDSQGDDGAPLILVGEPPETEMTAEKWKKLWQSVSAGGTAIILSHNTLSRGEDSTGWLPLEHKGSCFHFNDWLYHKECVAKKHPYFDGLGKKGALDNDYYDQVIPRDLFDMKEMPSEIMAAAFAVGYPMDGGYASGIIVGAYRLGQGRFVINTFSILGHLDANPVADRLLLNIILHEKQIK